jgi:hypothetical protein
MMGQQNHLVAGFSVMWFKVVYFLYKFSGHFLSGRCHTNPSNQSGQELQEPPAAQGDGWTGAFSSTYSADPIQTCPNFYIFNFTHVNAG